LLAKCVLVESASEATEACGTDQLCAGLKSGIEGAVHASADMWEEHKQEEDYGFLLIDAKNAFNAFNRIQMLWTVRHEWAKGARFTFNCYKHWAILVVRDAGGTGTIIHSKEGVTQGDPISMFGYGVGTLPLARQLKAEVKGLHQPWYADDAGAQGKFEAIGQLYDRLEEIGPYSGYFPESSKSILIVGKHNLERAKEYFKDYDFTITTGNRYLGGFIGEETARDEWIQNEIEEWVFGVDELASAAVKFPQASYAALQKSLQQRWQYVQRVVRGVGSSFDALQESLASKFLPALFGESLPTGDERIPLSSLPNKHAGLALSNPSESAELNFAASRACVDHLVEAIKSKVVFRTSDHLRTLREAKSESKSKKKATHEATFNEVTKHLPRSQQRALERAKVTGQFLSVIPSQTNGTVLSAAEFRDAILIRYSRQPSDLQKHCDGCGKAFDVNHALTCKRGGLIIVRHDEIRDELCDIASKALIPSKVRDEPKIHPGHTSRGQEQQEAEQPVATKLNKTDPNEDRGDILIRGLWERGTDCIIDVRITDLDSKTNWQKEPMKALAQHEKEKKKKYLQPCLEQRRHFTPFVASTDGLIGKEGKVMLKRLSALLANKWTKPYSEVCGYVNARMSIASVRGLHMCLRGSRVPTNKMSQLRPQWEDSAGLSLFRC
jgi:hypothetical protein